MNYPVVELITQDVETTLRGIRMAGGYQQDAVVEREKQQGNERKDNKIIVKQMDSEFIPNDVDRTPEGRIAYSQRYHAECHVVESETSNRPIDQRINLIRADVEKAILVDHTRGGNAHNTILSDPIPMVDEQGRWEGVIVPFDVHYRTYYGDPYRKGYS